MEEKNLKEKLSEHWSKHKVKYLFVVSLSAAAAAGYILGKSRVSVGNNNTFNENEQLVFAPLAETVIMTNIATAGHPGNIIEDPSTGDIWLSQNKAAEALGVTKTKLMQMLVDGELINHGANTGVSFAGSHK